MNVARIALCCALTVGGPAFAQQTRVSFWRLGDMTLRMEAHGTERNLLVEALSPRQSRDLGIAPGATLWEGSRKGRSLIGEAIAYKAGCEPIRYQASGDARLDSRGQLFLKGKEPSRAADSCARGPLAADHLVTWHLVLKGKPTDFKDEE